MKTDLHNYMKAGIIHFMAYPEVIKGDGNVLETLQKIAVDDYFDAVEITWIKDKNVREQAKSVLDTSGITVAYGAQPRLLTTGLNINDTVNDKRKQAIENLKEGIDEAYEMNAVGFAFLSGKYDKNDIDEAFNALLKSTRELCDYAKSKGNIKILHEIFDFDVDKKSLIGPVSMARKYAEIIRKEYDNFGLMVDLSHLPLLRETPKEALEPIKEFLMHIHIGNCVVSDPSAPAYGDMHPRFGFPNSENNVDELTEFLRTLFDIGYLNETDRPIVSFEVKPYGNETSELVIANAKRTLNAAWAKL